jgi:hypothetical protein
MYDRTGLRSGQISHSGHANRNNLKTEGGIVHARISLLPSDAEYLHTCQVAGFTRCRVCILAESCRSSLGRETLLAVSILCPDT